jgi:hypothetical protein
VLPKGQHFLWKAIGFAQDQTSYAGLDLASFQKQACLLLRRIQLFMLDSGSIIIAEFWQDSISSADRNLASFALCWILAKPMALRKIKPAMLD